MSEHKMACIPKRVFEWLGEAESTATALPNVDVRRGQVNPAFMKPLNCVSLDRTSIKQEPTNETNMLNNENTDLTNDTNQCSDRLVD